MMAELKSATFNFRMEGDLKTAAACVALAEGLSLSAMIEKLLRDHMKHTEVNITGARTDALAALASGRVSHCLVEDNLLSVEELTAIGWILDKNEWEWRPSA